MVVKRKKRSNKIPELDAFLAEGVAAEEEVAALLARLATVIRGIKSASG